MSRVAVDNRSASYGGMSKLPRPVGSDHIGSYQPRVQNDSGSGRSRKPSRLEQMQEEYQKNILREKEQKLIGLYEENQQRALQKVNNQNNKGMVRDFFRERRAMGSGKNNQNHNQPTMTNMYNRKKIEHRNNQYGPVRAQTYNPGQPQKQSAGRDRSNLLAPINGPGQNSPSGNPFPQKAQIVRPRTYKDVSVHSANKVEKLKLPMSAPTGQMMTDSSSDDSPPPNPKQLQMLQQKRQMMKNMRNNKTAITQPNQQTTPKKTDFQKWQDEQDQNRSNRLKNHRDANMAQKHQQPVDDEGFDDDSVESDGVDPQEEMKRKQMLLMQQIEDQQRELERLKVERMRAETEEKKEQARRKKMEEERLRREKEEEENRRKMEEDERVKRTWEEEKQRKMAEEKQRLRNASQSNYEYEDSDEEQENYQMNRTYKKPTPPPPQQHHKPSAPSKPKPTKTRKHHPPKSRTPPRQETPPMPRGNHVALYEGADHMEGAFENVGRLVSCFNCGRKFAEDRIEKHEKFCKNATTKRKVLDPTKLRTQGTEMAQYVGQKRSNNPKPKKNNWREQHESFITAIKYAKKCKEIEEQGGSLADLPPPPRSENPDYVQCQYCSRRFNPQTAERHIPHCKNTKSRPAPPPKRR